MDKTAFEDLWDMPEDMRGRTPTLRIMARPTDSNVAGDVFGGWLLSQMDIAGALHAHRFVRKRIVTVGVEAMNFHKPVFIGDEVSFYTDVVKTGHTSITMKIEAWAFRREGSGSEKVTEGLYTYVAIDEDRKPVALQG